jgi:hypothetical protein
MSEPKFDPLSVIPPLEVIAEQLREADERAARLRLLYKTALKIERSGRKPAHRSGSAPKSAE